MSPRRRSAARPLVVEPLEDRLALATLGYAFTPIAMTGPKLIGFGNFGPSINNQGLVAFDVTAARGRFEGIYTGDGKSITPVYVPGDDSFFSSPTLNNHGTAAFTNMPGFFLGVLGYRPPIGVLAGDGVLTRMIDRGPTVAFTTPSINDAGTVAYVTFDGGLELPFGLGGDPGKVRSQIVLDGSHVLYQTDEFFSTFSEPALNNAGTVAFTAFLQDGRSGLFTGDGVTTTTIAEIKPSVTFSFGLSVALNDFGQVAFAATLTEGAEGVFIGDGVTTTTIADTSGPYRGFNYVSINNQGQVAFWAALEAPGGIIGLGGHGIFTGPDPATDKVIAVGDELFGSSVIFLGFYRQGLNDAGQVAFFAKLADGRNLIVRADPINTPPDEGGAVPAAAADVFLVLTSTASRPLTGPGNEVQASPIKLRDGERNPARDAPEHPAAVSLHDLVASAEPGSRDGKDVLPNDYGEEAPFVPFV